jgi:hypothetical protein
MRLVAALSIVVVIAAACFAQDAAVKQTIKNEQVDLSVYGPWKGGSRRVRAWSDVVGERVVAEGLAWGVREKGLGQRVVLDHGHVYIDGDELPNGKLVRVTGTLKRGEEEAAPPGAQGYGEGFSYFYIKAEKIEQVDVVRAPTLIEPAAKP